MLRTRGKSIVPLVETKVQLGNYKVNYVRAGASKNNSAVLLLPGAMGSAQAHYSYQLTALPDLLKGYTIIAWDAPGYGKSQPSPKPHHLDTFFENAKVAHQLMQSLGYHSYSALGWNDGSTTAMIMASRYPEAVQRIVILGSRAFLSPRDRMKCEKLANIDNWSLSQRESLVNVYGERELRTLASNWAELMLDIYQKRSGNLCKEVLDKIQCPALIVHGAKDPLIAAEHAHFLHKRIKASHLNVFPEGKHNVHQRFPREFNQLVADFLQN